MKEHFENPTASERSAKSRSLMRTKFEDCKNKKLSSQFKTRKAVESVQNSERRNFVESHQNSEVQEDAGQLKKAVGDRVEFTSKLKKGVE